MSRTSEIVREKIFNAIRGLQAAGIVRPTGDQIRKVIGVGSNTTIFKYYREYLELNEQISPNEVEHSANDKLPESLLRIINDLWNMVRCEAKAKSDIILAEAEEAKILAQQENEVTLTKIAKLEEINQTLVLRLNHLQADYELLQKTLNESKKQEQILNERAIRLAENLQQNQELYQLAMKEFNENAAQREQRLEKEITLLRDAIEKQRHKWITEQDALKIEKNKAGQHVIRIEAKLNEMAKRYQDTEEAKQRLEIDQGILMSTLEKYKNEVISKDKTIMEYELRHHQQEKHITELKDKITRLEQRLEKAIERVSVLKANNLPLKHKIIGKIGSV